MPVESLEAAKLLVETWVNDRGFPISPTSASDDFSFQFARISQLGIGFVVLQPKNLRRAIVVATRIDIHPFHVKAIESLSPVDRDDFLWNLKKDLLFAAPGFSFSDPNSPKFIEFSKEISFDELTEGRLQNTVEQTSRCVLLVAWSMNRKFGNPPTEG